MPEDKFVEVKILFILSSSTGSVEGVTHVPFGTEVMDWLRTHLDKFIQGKLYDLQLSSIEDYKQQLETLEEHHDKSKGPIEETDDYIELKEKIEAKVLSRDEITLDLIHCSAYGYIRTLPGFRFVKNTQLTLTLVRPE